VRGLSLIPLQFAPAPMRLFALRVEFGGVVPVQCPHNADACKHRRAVLLCDEDQGLNRVEPVRLDAFAWCRVVAGPSGIWPRP